MKLCSSSLLSSSPCCSCSCSAAFSRPASSLPHPFLLELFPSLVPQLHGSPTAHSAYEVESIESTEIVLSLNAGKKWAEPKDDKGVEIVVSKIDTGAGEVVLNDVIIAKVLPDSDTAQCDDSCEWALDGVCDDGSSSGRYWWDDDYGGFYGYDDNSEYGYGYYYDGDDDFLAPVCEVGTDCTDCGGPKILTEDDLQRCDNSCQWSNDGYCDDTRTSGLCELGTDCHDCGPIDHGNYST